MITSNKLLYSIEPSFYLIKNCFHLAKCINCTLWLSSIISVKYAMHMISFILYDDVLSHNHSILQYSVEMVIKYKMMKIGFKDICVLNEN